MELASQTRATFDADGFLTDADRWDRDLACDIAERLGITRLSQAHWAVICYLRVHYLTDGSLPWQAHICRDLALEKGCVRQLFGGPLRAWKVAGLPNPGEEARTYLFSLEPKHPG